MTWGSDLGLFILEKKKKKRKKKWQSCQSKTKEKKLVTFSLEYALSLCTIKTAEVIG